MISRRLQKELIHLKDKSLNETGIFYFMKEDNMTKATAIMFGPKDTPYEFCPLEYTLDIPSEYPFSPPIVLYKTNDGKTRFHPNFYIDGKVCLSILGTYSGPKWASSMNISTVLLSIYSLMTDNPLTQEPCYETSPITNQKNQQYASFVEHQMIQLFFSSMGRNYYEVFMKDEDFKKTITNNYELLKEKIAKKAIENETIFTLLPYSMNGNTSWKQ